MQPGSQGSGLGSRLPEQAGPSCGGGVTWGKEFAVLMDYSFIMAIVQIPASIEDQFNTTSSPLLRCEVVGSVLEWIENLIEWKKGYFCFEVSLMPLKEPVLDTKEILIVRCLLKSINMSFGTNQLKPTAQWMTAWPSTTAMCCVKAV